MVERFNVVSVSLFKCACCHAYVVFCAICVACSDCGLVNYVFSHAFFLDAESSRITNAESSQMRSHHVSIRTYKAALMRRKRRNMHVCHRNNRYRMRTWSRIMSPLFLMHALT